MSLARWHMAAFVFVGLTLPGGTGAPPPKQGVVKETSVKLAPKGWRVGGFVISPDGKTLFYVATKERTDLLEPPKEL